ncbi:MAG: hypothetical protein M0R28_21405 [Pigmentiphaga sp.]|nr:hypothetical protein [Pigmentiphaga sp.]
MAGAYATGVQTGWVVHGTLLGGVPTSLTGRAAREWRDRAFEHGEVIANRFGHLLEAEPTVAQLTRHASVAGESSVWAGQDAAAAEVAILAEAEWKVWVRAWPRKEHRDWHDALEGVTIPEENLFTLPGGPNQGAQVYGPRDWDAVPDAGEHLNCAHALRYQRHATAEDLEGTKRGVGVIYTPPTASATWAGTDPQQTEALLAGNTNRAFVATLDEALAQALGSQARAVQLSADTLAKQRRNHPEVPESLYRQIDELIKNADTVLVMANGTDLGFIAPTDTSPIFFAVKTTRARNELFLVSLHYMNSHRVEGKVRKAQRVIRKR